MTGYTEAQHRAINQYRKEKVESLIVYVPKGKKDVIKAAAASSGLTMSQFINQAIDREIKAAASGNSAAASDPEG